MVPTFASTILVFTILQMAPGGPIEQIMLRCKWAAEYHQKADLHHHGNDW